MNILLFHPSVPPFVRQTARAYQESGALELFATTFVYQPSTKVGKALLRLYGLVSRDAGKQLSRRAAPEIPSEKTRSRPGMEVVRTLATRWAGPVVQDFLWERAELGFDRHVSRLDWGGATVVHGYEHAALDTFREARRRGRRLIYEMPAPFHKTTTRILEAEYQKFAELATPERKAIEKKTAARNRRREQEAEMADVIVCNSGFTAESLREHGIAREKIVVVPYGMPEPIELPLVSEPPDKMVFLYAGTLSVRKGVHCLLEAWRRLQPPPDAELRMFGAIDLPPRLLEGLPGRVQVHPTVPRGDLYANYREASLLLFPTLCDGFGMVLTEALSQGLPVLTTRRAGSCDFIDDGRTGFIVPPGDPDAIAERLSWCLANREAVWGMRPACLEKARGWQWADYRTSLVSQIAERLGER